MNINPILATIKLSNFNGTEQHTACASRQKIRLDGLDDLTLLWEFDPLLDDWRFVHYTKWQELYGDLQSAPDCNSSDVIQHANLVVPHVGDEVLAFALYEIASLPPAFLELQYNFEWNRDSFVGSESSWKFTRVHTRSGCWTCKDSGSVKSRLILTA